MIDDYDGPFSEPLGPDFEKFIAEKIVHPGYSRKSKDAWHDIALLRLSSSLEFNDGVKPICLPLANHLWHKDFTGQNLTTAGFGKTIKTSITQFF